ncbi:hypothetical protein [Nitrosarchaeum koreense]|uniref:Uncharacterized protein n=1 Tax=Nitrosarchaeum koreense MY1 TaxID=1001994 RepID=F9CVA1_9ARCH|nr:hypothetical protein [Nitrosarchaeum koreense]EGP94727.1 hypothetical protein MY1_1983 [Nitrosarchaeum koreense MY1]
MHFDIEFLGTSDVQALIVHDAEGGDDLDVGTEFSNVNQFWDTADLVDSDFTFTPVSDTITINTDGLYHVAYTTFVERAAVANRFEFASEILVNDVPKKVCIGSGFARGAQGGNDVLESAAESSCYVDLKSGDTLKLRITKTSDTSNNVALTISNRTSFVAQNMDFRTEKAAYKVTLKETLPINDGTVTADRVSFALLEESLSLNDVIAITIIGASGEFNVFLDESLSLNDDVIARNLVSKALLEESLLINDGTVNSDKYTTKLVFLSGADTAEVGVDIDSTSDVDILWNVQNRTNGFEHTVGTKDIIVPADGVYRVSYGLSITTTGTDRYTAISHVNVNDSNSGSCYDSGFNRGTSSSFDSTVKAECLLDLSEGDTVSIAARRTSTATGMNPQLNAASSWFQIQQITNPNVIILHEATGGDTLSTEGGTLDLTWDTEDRKDTPFEHQSGSSDVKVLFDGLYRVSYSVKHSASGSIRTGTGGAIQIQPEGGSFTNATSGWSSAYLRMASGIDEAALAASTILNLKFKRYHQTCLN